MDEVSIRSILVVDDDANIVNAVRRELYAPPFGYYDYDVEGFTDPALALRRAAEWAFDAVICDYRMPGMNGLEFLTALAQLRPDCARIVLSGETDMGALTRMVNESHIYRFIAKPWNGHHLKAALAQAIEYSAILVEKKRLADLAREHGVSPAPGEADAIDQVLFVDDEMGVLNSLARVLPHRPEDELALAIRDEVARRTGAMPAAGRIGVQATPSPANALKLAESVDFSCVVADLHMPEMDGIELLQKFSYVQPDCGRILISGGIGQDDLIRAVNAAHISAFVDKPWNDFDLKVNILLAISRHRMLRENRRQAKLMGS